VSRAPSVAKNDDTLKAIAFSASGDTIGVATFDTNTIYYFDTNRTDASKMRPTGAL
jgi:DNA-binding beta-propeller fold protein YncE